ncbi:hypothetical protein GCM10007852_24040 [Agaribacter marinus]|uniref:Uncharacterized protein n=1 Tax=Agaribacter marinus TaxID=1431249 RepID=A0AA37SX83_9ALTE|nr:hypothetical protein GCM10007852_24040 [Agaribacter marinus]
MYMKKPALRLVLPTLQESMKFICTTNVDTVNNKAFNTASLFIVKKVVPANKTLDVWKVELTFLG